MKKLIDRIVGVIVVFAFLVASPFLWLIYASLNGTKCANDIYRDIFRMAKEELS